jgi:hypothetical protein
VTASKPRRPAPARPELDPIVAVVDGRGWRALFPDSDDGEPVLVWLVHQSGAIRARCVWLEGVADPALLPGFVGFDRGPGAHARWMPKA